MIAKTISSLGICLLLTVVSFAQLDPYHYTSIKKMTVSRAAVVSAHPLASDAGLEVMKMGGNAVDAAIATQLALAVVYPGAGNLGGGGFMVAHFANGKNYALDYRETAPGKAFRDMYLDSAGNANTTLSQKSRLASGVPGTVAGIFASLKYAKLPFRLLIARAIVLADKGFAITAGQANSFNGNRDAFIKANVGNMPFVKTEKWKAGDTLIQKDLAITLKRMRDLGAKGFYEGVTAKLIEAEMKRGQGIISLQDLKNYRAREREIMQFPYKEYQVLTMPLPSSGGLIIQQLMKMIEKRDIKSLQFQTPASVQLMVEAERRAYADRANFMGDPDFVKVPVAAMVSDSYLEKRMADFIPGKAGSSSITKAGVVKESEETTHLSVMDEKGNAVSVTTTLNDGYGNKTMVRGAGFLLNNEMDDFSIKEGVPNMYGAVGNAANAIAPNKRMLSSMTPVIVLKNNLPYIVVGTPGGTTIPTSVFQSLVNILEFGLSEEEAVNRPKFHHQWLPDIIEVEKDFPAAVTEALKSMGYTVKTRGDIGRVELIRILPAEKKLNAIGDKRGDDAVRGW